MTRAEILALPAGRELDALVAEKVLGCTVQRNSFGTLCCGCPRLPHGSHEGDGWHAEILAAYSSDIAAAWQVVEKMLARPGMPSNRLYWHPYMRHWVAAFTTAEEHGELGRADTAPLAICRAALLATLNPD